MLADIIYIYYINLRYNGPAAHGGGAIGPPSGGPHYHINYKDRSINNK